MRFTAAWLIQLAPPSMYILLSTVMACIGRQGHHCCCTVSQLLNRSEITADNFTFRPMPKDGSGNHVHSVEHERQRRHQCILTSQYQL